MPTISNLDDLTVNENGVIGFDNDVTVTGTDIANGRLVISGLLPEDRLTLTGDPNFIVSGNQFFFRDVLIGTFSGGIGSPFVFLFSANANAGLAETVIERLAYTSVSDNPTASRGLTVTISGPDTFAAKAAILGDAGSYAAPAFADVNGDGQADLVIGSLNEDQTAGIFRAYTRGANGTYTELTGSANPFATLNASGDGAVSLDSSTTPTFANLVGDERPDMVVGVFDGTNTVLQVYTQDASGQYVRSGTNPLASVGTYIGLQYINPVFGDVNGDNLADLVVGSDNGEIRIALRNEDGSFGAATLITTIAEINTAPRVAVDDVDGDGDGDLLVSIGGDTTEAQALLLFANNGNGTYTRQAAPAQYQYADYLTFGDLDGDGRRDLVSGDENGTLAVQTSVAGQTSSASNIVNVTAVNDAPTITNLQGDAVTFTENSTTLVALDVGADAVVADADNANFNGGSLTVSVTNAIAGDQLLFAARDGIGNTATEVTFNGTAFATFNAVGSTRTFTFNADATPAAAQALIRAIEYVNSTAQSATDRQISFTLTDGAGGSVTNTTSVAFVNVNDAPTLSGADTATYTENGSPTAVAPNLLVADVDNTTLTGATVSIGTNFSAGDQLNFINGNGITGSYNTATGVLTLSGTASIDAYQAALRSVAYSTSSDNPDTQDRTINFTVNDGSLDSATASSTVQVTAVNDAPINTVPQGLTINEDAAAFVPVTGLSVSDVDSDTLTVTLSVTEGTGLLSLSQVGGLTFSAGDGRTDQTLTFSGTQADINNALASLDFSPAQNYNGVATITMTSTDSANASDTDTVAIAITPVNDAPENGVTTTTFAGNEDAAAIAITGLSVSDVDAGDTLSVTLSTGNGTLTLGTTAGLTFTAGDGTADATLTFTGTREALNTALASLNFAPAANFNGAAAIQFTTSDGMAQDSDTLTVSVAAVNDAPVAVDDAISFTRTMQLITNGGFENGLTGWRLTSAGGGTFITTTGPTTTPSGFTLPAPQQGAAYAVSRQGGPAVDALEQTIIVPTGTTSLTLSYSMFVRSSAAFDSGNGLSNTGSSQFGRVDLLQDPSAAFSTGTDVIRNFYFGIDGNTFQNYTFNILGNVTPGSSYDLRFAQADTQGYLDMGVDAVSVSATVGATEDNVSTIDASILLANDSDVDGDTLVVTGVSATSAGGAAVSLANGVISYDPRGVLDRLTAGESFADSFTYTISDGQGGTATATARFTVTGVNDAAVIDLNGSAAGSSTTLAYTENQAPTAIAPAATVTDVDSANFDGGTLTVAFTAGGAAEDQLSLLSSETLQVENGTIRAAGAQIGTYTGGTNGAALVISFNANATPALVQQVTEAVAYANASENPSAATRTLSYTLTDGDGGTATTAATITVTPVDDAPVAVADAGAVLETGTTSGNVLGNDTDIDGGARTVSAVNGVAANVGQQITLASGALLTLNSDGTYVYNPNGAFERLAGPDSGAPIDQTQATDTFSYTLNGGSTATVTVTVTGEDNNDTFTVTDKNAGDTRIIATGTGNDQFTGLGTANYVVDGGAGNDRIVTDQGNDRVTGGTGDDFIETGAGNDDVSGGDGNDTIVGGAGEGDDLYDGGSGTDTVTYTSQGTGANLVINLVEADRSQGAGAVFPTGAPADIGARLQAIMARNNLPVTTAVGYAYGGAIGVDAMRGIENVTSGAGDDVIVGNAGANTIDAGAGNDLVSGGAGNDVLIGGEGVDTLFYGDITNIVQVNLAEGQVNAGAQGGVDQVSGFENVILGSGNDQFIGDAGDNAVEGGAGNDQLDGGAGIDTAVYRGVQAADGTATQLGNELSLAAGGGLGTDRLSNIERVTFVNGADVFTVTVQDGNALVASRDDTGAVTATSTTDPDAQPAVAVRFDANGVLSNDVNLDQGVGDQKVVAAVSFGDTQGTLGQSLAGTYGSLIMNADGGYTYIANSAATVALNAGATAQDVFTYRADDGDVGDSAPATLTITVTGANEAATITGTATGGVTEDAATTLTTSGQLTVTDADTGEAVFRTQAGTAGTNGYGSFSLDAAGVWTYSADNSQAAVQQLSAGQTITDSFTAVSSDGTATQVVTVTITGTNDDVTLAGGQIATIADTAVTDTFAVISGRIDNDPDAVDASGAGQLNDVDRGDVYTYTLVGAPDASLGTFVLNSDGSYTFTPDSAAINALPEGAQRTLTYTVEVSDGAGSTSQAEFAINVTGANDDATIGGTLTGSVTEDVNVTPATDDAPATLTTSGTVTVSDVDTDQATIQPQTGTFGDYGIFTIDAAGNWTYSVNNDEVQFLGAGETLTDSFIVTSADGTGSNIVSVTINGTNDTPVLTGGDLVTYQDTSETDTFAAFSGQISNTNTNSNGIFLPLALVEGEANQPVGTLFDGDFSDRDFTFARAGSAEENAINDAYGTLVVNPDGSYTFTPNDAAINALTGTLVLEYTISATDGSNADNATGTGTFTITLNGVDDAPVTGGDITASVTEDAVASGTTNLVATGTLTVIDPDTDQSTYQPQTLTGTYGTFVIAADGSYTYTADNTQRSIQEIGQGDTRTDTFTALTADGTEQTVTVTINGVNDAPVVMPPENSVLVDTTSANGSFATATSLDGLFGLAANANVGDATTVPHVSIQGTTSGGVIDYYTFTVGAGGGTVTLDVDNADFDTGVAIFDAAGNRLAGNDDAGDQNGTNPGETSLNSFLTATLAAGTYTVAIDRHAGVGVGRTPNPAEPGSTYELQVSLTNPAVLTTAYTQTVTETDSTIALTGQLVVLDDVGDTDTFARTAASVTASGRVLTADQQAAVAAAFTVDAATGAYAFNLASPDYLDPGQSITATFTVTVTDQLGASTTQDVTYTINGALEQGPVGTLDDDVLTGGQFGDAISGLAGDDIIRGLGGNDVIDAGNGDDQVDGGSGDDQIYGGSGDDQLVGGSGNDQLFGGADNDTLSGGSGDDVLSAGTGINTVDGGAGNDTGVLELTSDQYLIESVNATTARFTSNDSSERTTFSNVESYRFVDGTKLVLNAGGRTLTGNADDNVLAGGTGTNFIDGGAGTDTGVLVGNYADYTISQGGNAVTFVR
ncbi:VCBS domain-containing protein, partial [uncultured Sphingomonas sp.]|uniref:VCBS domain-containing protein n=1 Tax=uncultured Sphingomonas sp. TaxID=158754 RepID=UPI0025E51163